MPEKEMKMEAMKMRIMRITASRMTLAWFVLIVCLVIG
jgi:hypothetical protein